MKEYIIVGAGPVGLAVAMLLQKKGHSIKIFDKRKDPRKNPEHGRSINLALSHRGFKTLALLGLEDLIKKDFSISMSGRMVHDLKGNENLQPYSTDNKCIFSVSRAKLTNLLLDIAESRGITLQFDSKCELYDIEKENLVFENEVFSTRGKFILGCDGAFSPLRKSLKNVPGTEQQERKLEYGYKEFTIPANSDGSWKIEKHALHIWPRKNFMLIALPNLDGSFTCTLFLNLKGPDSFEDLDSLSNAQEFFIQNFPDVLAIMDHFENDFIHNPISSLFMETCAPWNLDEKLLLLGDAAHAIVPFYGQGLNAGLEDVRIFIEEMEQPNGSFHHFQKARKFDIDAIGALALQNFIEMRDLVTNDTFLLKKKLESKIKKLYPKKWMTQYEQVTFSDLPYSKAQHNGIENDRKLSLILENPTLTNNLLNETISSQDMYLLSLIVL